VVVGPGLARELLVLADDQEVDVHGLGQLAGLGHKARVQGRIGRGQWSNCWEVRLAFTNAAAQEVQARFNLATARAKLLLALGRQ
jgi:hypothetical protein